jgi:hypothetical protein
MNLLKVQDALKNASDQQLMALMQAPDSTAPSYLVLSEIRRRKDMRSQQAPEGQSNRTVADDLIAQDDGGIRDIVAHDEPEAQDGAEEMAAGGLASLRRYAEGGVVRMQAGGASPITSRVPSGDEFGPIEYSFASGSQDPIIFGRPLHTYSLEELQRLRADERAGVNLLTGPRSDRPAIPMAAIENRIATLRGRTAPRFAEPGEVEGPRISALAGAPGGAFGGEENTLAAAQPSTTTTATTPPPAAQPPAAQPPADRPARPAAAQPTPAPAARPQGIEALRPGSAEGTEPSQSSVQFTDRLSPLFARMQEGRVDPAARRNEAMNMALIEAGLRIASSRNPSLAGAIGEGAAPAVQAYSQQLGQIRQDQRQDLRDELQGALAQNQNDYYRGRLSQQEFATRQAMIIERLRQDREDTRTGLREAGATARNAATIAGQREPANVQELRYLEDLRVNNPAAYDAAMRARQTGVASAEIRGSAAMARSIQEAINSDRSIQMMRIQRTQLESTPNRTQAQERELANLLGRINAAELAIEQRYLRLGSGAGGLPVSDRPVGSGPVVQPPPR